ncbi:MAG: fasciclin domain-containing protein [Bacteroidales bacterium]|nr:fasciclin domain-containing protein [Bacteroidales bacterium]
MKFMKHYLLALVSSMMVLASCNDDWDERTSLIDPSLSDTDLWEEVSEQSNLSIFKEILTKTGYAQYLSADYDISVLTVFAPTDEAFNAAFQNGTLVREEFMADIDGLKDFLNRHIANTMHMGELSIDPYRVKMWDGRRVYFAPKADASGKMYVDEDIPLTDFNIMCKNGVMHTINSIIPDRDNVWTAATKLLTSNGDPLQLLNAISRFDYRAMDPESRINGYNEADQPTYDTLWIDSNHILDFKDISNEDTVYTYVVLQDEGYIPLAAKYGKIYKRDVAAESDSLTIMNLNLDLIFPGDLNLKSAGEYESVTGVRVKLDPADLIKITRASNGYVYEMRTASITFRNNKVKDVIIEGELTDYTDANFPYKGRSATLYAGDTFLRGKLWKVKYRTWASNNNVLNLGGFYREQGNNNDPLSIGGDRPGMFSMFTKARPDVFSVPYSFYWRMGNDIEKDSTRQIAQRIYVSSPSNGVRREVTMRNSSLLRVDNNEVYTQEFADTAALYPPQATQFLERDPDRQTFAFYASIQDSMRKNYWLNNQYSHDTIPAADVMAWLLENNRFEDYHFFLSEGDNLPMPGTTETYFATGEVNELGDPIYDTVILASLQYVRDYYEEYRQSEAYPADKHYLDGIIPQRVTHIDAYDADGNAYADRFLLVAFPDPTSGWKKSDYYTLENTRFYQNHEQPLYLTYAYKNGGYDTWVTNKEDAAYNRHNFEAYGTATLLITRNFTGVESSNMFQQNVYVAIDYIRMVPYLDDIDE